MGILMVFYTVLIRIIMGYWWDNNGFALWYFNIAIEYGPFSSMIYLFDMVIFFRYVNLPKGNLPFPFGF